MKKITTICLILFCLLGYGQKDLKKLEGIWIAQEFYDSFEKTKSAVQSKKAFDFSYPIGIRINTKEIKKGIMNIGYSVLHDHSIHPEISDYKIQNKDTIREQGSFKINLRKKDSSGYYKTTDIYPFNFESISYLKWNLQENSFTLYRPKNKELQEKYIHYKRITTQFRDDYSFPNPIYYYTRKKTLIGNYIIKDNKGKILSEKFQIKENGIAKGFKALENFKVDFSTDIYCGPPAKYDLVMFFDSMSINNYKTYYYLYLKNENGNIDLYERLTNEQNGTDILGKKIYELIKN